MHDQSKQSGLLIVGHGSTENPDSSEPILGHCLALRKRELFAEAHCVFWKEEPALHEAEYLFEKCEEIFVVPNFISEGYFTQTVIPRELKLSGPITERDGKRWNYCEPVGNHPHMTELILKRAREVAPQVNPAEASLLIVGHGTALNDNSAIAAKREVQKIEALGQYGEVLNTYMEEAPLISDWAELTKFSEVVVVPFFISDGLHSYQDIPVLLGIEEEGAPAASQRQVFRQNPYHLKGKCLHYASALGTEPGFADLLLDQVRLFEATHRN